jgi:hypothetical protein
VFIEKIMKYPIYMSLSYNSHDFGSLTSNTLVLVLLASRAHAHDLLLVSVLVSEVELKLSNIGAPPIEGLSLVHTMK